jgi:hypothetical protein
VPVRKVKGGFRFGTKGKVFKRRADAVRQGQAIHASKSRKKRKKS